MASTIFSHKPNNGQIKNLISRWGWMKSQTFTKAIVLSEVNVDCLPNFIAIHPIAVETYL